MADLGWLRYAAPDQVPGLREIDRRARPWREVPGLVRCGACLGALPPDTEAACSVCGTGSWRPLAKSAPVLPERGVSSTWATFPNLPEEASASPSAAIQQLHDALVGAAVVSAQALMVETARLFDDARREAEPTPAAGPLGEVEDWENGDVVLTFKPRRRPWWMFWRSR